MDSETFGIEKGHGRQVVDWLNAQAGELDLKFEARLYGHEIATRNFGSFEMFSWIGDARAARRLSIRAGKRFRIRMIEGGYKTREAVFRTRKSDYGMVRRGDRVIGRLELESPLFGSGRWTVKAEERR